jgi:hypothetical protein
MTLDDPIRIPSPDSGHEATLALAGEVRFGPQWFSLTIDGHSFGPRAFGEAAIWSPDSRYLAAQWWLSTEEGRGPNTVLLLIDWRDRRECAVDQARGGFIAPEHWEGAALVYTKTYYDRKTNRVTEHRRALTALAGWLPLKLAG